MSPRLLIEHHLEFLSFKGGYTGSSESTLVKIPHCWKSHVTAYIWAAMRETWLWGSKNENSQLLRPVRILKFWVN